MTIKFTVSLAGCDFTRNIGDIDELPDAEANRLIDAGFAVPVSTIDVIETADVPQDAIEQATAPQVLKVKPKPLPAKVKAQ